jgi:hypothetical protein
MKKMSNKTAKNTANSENMQPALARAIRKVAAHTAGKDTRKSIHQADQKGRK